MKSILSKFKVDLILVLFLIISCTNSNNSYQYKETVDDEANELKDENIVEPDFNGEYCATVEYFNNNTVTKSEYQLIIEADANELLKINFPQGWLDQSHFSGGEFDEEGFTEITDDQGYKYSIQILGEASDCFINMPLLNQCLALLESGKQCLRLTDNTNKLCWQHQMIVNPLESEIKTEYEIKNISTDAKIKLVNEILDMIESSYNSGDIITLGHLLSFYKFIPQANLIYIKEIDKPVLFIQTFSGGAHCCISIDAYLKENNAFFYKFMDSFSFDGDYTELVYPFTVNLWHEYFHCAYAYGHSECQSGIYNDYLYFDGSNFYTKGIGNKERIEQCLISFLKSNKVPELQTGDDDGEREVILNLLSQLYKLTENKDYIKSLYFESIPPVSDKIELWNEIEKIIFPKK